MHVHHTVCRIPPRVSSLPQHSVARLAPNFDSGVWAGIVVSQQYFYTAHALGP
jgi:hypothetical protein